MSDKDQSYDNIADETVDTYHFYDADRRVLIPINDNEHSERAFTWYLDNIRKEKDELVLIHLVEPTGKSGTKDDFSKQIIASIDNGRIIRIKYLSNCENASLNASFTIHVGPKPGEQIVRMANDQQVDMVVIGNRGLGAIKRTLFGSVSDYIIHNLNIPVIIVPPGKQGKSK